MSRKPLWARALSDPEARKFLKQHRKEFPEASMVPDDVAFSDSFLPGNKFITEIVAEGRPYLKNGEPYEERERLAKLWLDGVSIPEIQRRMGWGRRQTYSKLKLLKLHAITKWRHRRRDLILAREDRSSDRAPISVRTFTFHGEERTVYKVPRPGGTEWVDEAGKVFNEEIQDILNHLLEERDGFEVLDVED